MYTLYTYIYVYIFTYFYIVLTAFATNNLSGNLFVGWLFVGPSGLDPNKSVTPPSSPLLFPLPYLPTSLILPSSAIMLHVQKPRRSIRMSLKKRIAYYKGQRSVQEYFVLNIHYLMDKKYTQNRIWIQSTVLTV